MSTAERHGAAGVDAGARLGRLPAGGAAHAPVLAGALPAREAPGTARSRHGGRRMNPALPAPPRGIPLLLKLGYTAFMLVLVPVYWQFYGPTNFLRFCDIA